MATTAIATTTTSARTMYGLVHPPGFTHSLLPINTHDGGSQPTEPDPVRLLPLDTFSDLHLKHTLAHPPDGVLFPFLHGLEADNESQNMFFATGCGWTPASATSRGKHKAKPPPFRGLIWVVCEEDLEADPPRYARELAVLRRKKDGGFGDVEGMLRGGVEGDLRGRYGAEGEASGSDGSEYDDDDDDEDDDDEEDEIVSMKDEVGVCVVREVDPLAGMRMDIDGETDALGDGLSVGVVLPDKEKKTLGQEDSQEGQYMHPVVQRPVGENTSNPFPSSGPPKIKIQPPHISPHQHQKPEQDLHNNHHPHPRHEPLDPSLCLLTSTFRPCEIVRRKGLRQGVAAQDGEGEWEFVPARVPEGISLRNFGIQVPIYATLADIIVYSPRGPSPAARRLAGRVREAVRRKWKERTERLGSSSENGEGGEEDLVRYNVFLLDADEESMKGSRCAKSTDALRGPDMNESHACTEEKNEHPTDESADGDTKAKNRKTTGVPHLLVRVCNGVPGGTAHAHTDRSDGHLVDMDVDGAAAGDPVVGETLHPARRRAEPLKSSMHTDLFPNTVDFAQREKEEMRDLTKASEIVGIFPCGGDGPGPGQERSLAPTTWLPEIGQVFLGNGDDVPVVGEGGERRKVGGGEGSPDRVLYHPSNDPTQGQGFDICIECHDLAPFPSAAHLKAAEEHLAMLDKEWVGRVIGGKAGSGGEQVGENGMGKVKEGKIPSRPPPKANAVIHLPFPSSPTNTHVSVASVMPVIRFLERCVRPVEDAPVFPMSCSCRNGGSAPVRVDGVLVESPSSSSSSLEKEKGKEKESGNGNGVGKESPRRWSFMRPFPTSTSSVGFLLSASDPAGGPPNASLRVRSLTAPAHTPSPPPNPGDTTPENDTGRVRCTCSSSSSSVVIPANTRTRPLKVLIYSADGYTESSVLALCLLMSVRRLGLPEAYLELQVGKRRSFFVYQGDLGILRRVEGRLREERERVEKEKVEKEKRVEKREREDGVNPGGKRVSVGGWSVSGWRHSSAQGQGEVQMQNQSQGRPPHNSSNSNSNSTLPSQQQQQQQLPMGRPAAKSVSFTQAPTIPPPVPPSMKHRDQQLEKSPSMVVPEMRREQSFTGRPRANTSPWLPSLFAGDHQSWFNDPRFDGSFPSRVLPFLYLGNLNHASNAYMLHALGITHVVSVGECALVPPPHHVHGQQHHAQGIFTSSSFPFNVHGSAASGTHYVPGKVLGQGSLWLEEREGRIKVLDIKGVCDDGIDTLEPQLEPICDWIDQARMEGGQVLVHCRVGVSRSATVTIAYVMKHLGLPLVDAYLIVRSRRLSVLIQPNMRLLYNLCGWEIKLAKARAGEDEERLRRELARTLSWPFLAKEVHGLNEKYLH